MVLCIFYFFLLSIICASQSTSRSTTATSSLPTANIEVNTQQSHQTIDGFGVSQAFQRARDIQRLSPSVQQYALDLLFNASSGAGLSILRNGIGSSPSYDRDWMKSIAPISPGFPNNTPKYEWDGDDAGQLWLTKEATKRGVDTIYANAWSAPGYMKTNGNDSYGAHLCGVRDTNCLAGDWRKAYAEYLLQYLRYYKEEGVRVTHLGFVNEPDLNQTYASMQASGFEIADILSALRPALQQSEFSHSTQIVCCEATGWGDGEDILSELQTVLGAEDSIDIYSAHGYSVNPSSPFVFVSHEKKVWQTEWAGLSGRWISAWDDLGKDGEGISWANKIHQALTLSNVSAFLYWIGASEGNSNGALARIQNGTVIPSGRLWALAQYSKFVRPGSTRVSVVSDVGYVKASAFKIPDGNVVIILLNNGHVDVDAEVELKVDSGDLRVAVPWTTSNSKALQRGEHLRILNSPQDSSAPLHFNFTLAKRSITSFVLTVE